MRFQPRRAALETLAGLAAELGADAAALRRAIGLDAIGLDGAGLDGCELDDDGAGLPPQAFQLALGLAARATGRDDFGLLLARRRTLDTLGQLAPLLESAPRVGEALDQLFRLLPFGQAGGVRAHIQRDGPEAMLVGQVVLSDPPALDQQIDHLAGAAVGVVRGVTRPDWTPEAVYLTRRRPASAAAYEAYFGAPVRFGQAVSGIAVRAALLDQPIARGNVARNRVLYAQLQAQAAAQAAGAGRGFAERVRERIWRGLGDGWGGEAGVAADLGLPLRTFQRRLAREGTGFAALLEEARLALAMRLMVHTEAPLGEIAAALGYAEPAVFSRFFRRRTGLAPSRWRTQNGRPSPAAR